MRAFAALAVLALAGSRVSAQELGADGAYSEWDTWQGFKDGSSSTMQYEGVKIETSVRRVSADKLELVQTKDGQAGTPWEVTRPKKGDFKCAGCKAHKPPKIDKASEKLKIAGKDLDCERIKAVQFDCEGKEAMTTTTWYNRGVPGWVVKTESDNSKGVCVAYTAK